MNTTSTKSCKQCKSRFEITPDDFGFYERMGVPAPGICPDCRLQRRLTWRNERTFYKRKCDLCGKSIVSMYHPRVPYAVYCEKCYKSDKWDARSYAINYDSSRPFMEQFGKLLLRVPKETLFMGKLSEYTDYQNFAGGNKNCYLVFNSADNEDSFYSRGIFKSKNTVDVYFGYYLELCYENVNINKSSKIIWGQNTINSVNSYFLLNCAGVQNCFGCVNLRHKSYHFFNEPLSKGEWLRRVSDIMGSYSKMEEAKKKFEEFSLKFPRRENNSFRSVNCSGEYIFESKNIHSSFEVFSSEDCKYSFAIKLTKDSYDAVGRGLESELLLETVAVGHGCSRVIGSWGVGSSYNIEYSHDLRSCEHCIGCAGLKNSQYSILNKQYSEAEYKQLRSHIIKELQEKGVYGLFLPSSLSPWAYNETLANDEYPLSKEQAITESLRWEDDIPRTRGQETLQSEQIPDHIKDVQDSILNEILACSDCGRNYRLIKSELEMYRKLLVPVPRQCFNCRHEDRLRRRGPFKLYDRTCAKCSKPIKTTYAPNRPEIVYCEACYQSEVV